MKFNEIDRICPSSMWDDFCGRDVEPSEEEIREKEETEELRIASKLEKEAIEKETIETEEKVWDAIGFAAYARFLCSKKDKERAEKEIQEALNLTRAFFASPILSDEHVKKLLTKAVEHLQSARECLMSGLITRTMQKLDDATSALKLVAKEVKWDITKI